MKFKTLLLATFFAFAMSNQTSAAPSNEPVDTALDKVIDAKIYPQKIFLNDDDWNGRHNYENGRHRGGHYDDSESYHNRGHRGGYYDNEENN